MHNARIDEMVQELYQSTTANWSRSRASWCGSPSGRGCSATRFFDRYFGHETDPRWLNAVSRACRKSGWKKFVSTHKVEIRAIRKEIARLENEIETPISDFRRIVQEVQRGERDAARAKRRWWRPIFAW